MNFFEKAQARAHAQEVLGLEGHAEHDEIRAAYKKLAREKHPDNGGSDDEFAKINEAYSLLIDDEGYSSKDRLRHAPSDSSATTFTPRNKKRRNKGPAPGNFADTDEAAEIHAGVRPNRARTAVTSRIQQLGEAEALECRMLLDEIPYMATPDEDEISLRASIMDVIQKADAPYVPHKNHLPYAIRQSGRRISYMVRENIERGVNRVAVPTGVFADKRKVLPIIVRFKAEGDGAGTHTVSSATLAESFPGAKSVRVHFALDEWPKPAAEQMEAYA